MLLDVVRRRTNWSLFLTVSKDKHLATLYTAQLRDVEISSIVPVYLIVYKSGVHPSAKTRCQLVVL